MKRTYELLPEFPYVQLTEREVKTLQRASAILAQLRELAGTEDDTADTSLGSADAALADVLRDLDHGRWIDEVAAAAYCGAQVPA